MGFYFGVISSYKVPYSNTDSPQVSTVYQYMDVNYGPEISAGPKLMSWSAAASS
jgi:hypothetical protein